MNAHEDTEELRPLFADAVRDVTPSPVPLAAIAQASRKRRRRRRSVLAAACGVLLFAAGVTVVQATAPSSVPSRDGSVQQPATPTAPVRVVAPGERVNAAPGAKVWLTEEGKYWSTPQMPEQFRSVVDGNVDVTVPGVGIQTEPVAGTYFFSGIYHGVDDAASVRVDTREGTVTGKLVRLAGEPGWGVWYATSPLPSESSDSPDFVTGVSVLDAAGNTLTSLDLRS